MTIDTGLDPSVLEAIRTVLARYEAVTHAVLYGSRAKGSWKPASDIDIAVEGIDDPLQAEKIRSDLDDLLLPWRFDVTPIDAVRSEPLQQHIRRVGIPIYGIDRPAK